MQRLAHKWVREGGGNCQHFSKFPLRRYVLKKLTVSTFAPKFLISFWHPKIFSHITGSPQMMLAYANIFDRNFANHVDSPKLFHNSHVGAKICSLKLIGPRKWCWHMPTFLTKISQTMLTGEKFFRSTHVGAQFFPISPGPCKRCWPVTTFFAQNPRYMLTVKKIAWSLILRVFYFI